MTNFSDLGEEVRGALSTAAELRNPHVFQGGTASITSHSNNPSLERLAEEINIEAARLYNVAQAQQRGGGRGV